MRVVGRLMSRWPRVAVDAQEISRKVAGTPSMAVAAKLLFEIGTTVRTEEYPWQTSG